MVNIKKNIRKMKKQLKRDFLTLPVSMLGTSIV